MKAFLAIALTASVLSVGFISTSANAMNLGGHPPGGGAPGGGNPGGGSPGPSSHGMEGLIDINTCPYMVTKKLANGKDAWTKKCHYR